jgi:hypothetical protein
MDIKTIGTNIANGVTITSAMAQQAAPIVSLYNPGAGALLATLAPLLGPIVADFVLTETDVFVRLNGNMSKEDMIKTLRESKSAMWGDMPSLEKTTP